MKIKGSFKTINDEICTVIIYNANSQLEDIDIDANDNIFFAESPLKIDYSVDDLFQTTISKSCTISLLTNMYLGDYLYANNERNIIVNVLVDNKIIFAGFVEPNIYSQGYANNFDKLDILCTDYLATLQYNNIHKSFEGIDENVSFATILQKVGLINNILDITKSTESKIYICDKGLTLDNETTTAQTFSNIKIPIKLFYDAIPEESETNDSVIEECLKYLNLHIIQEGINFYLFRYDVPAQNFTNVFDEKDKISHTISNYNVDSKEYNSDSTNVSLDETYTKIQVECELTPIEEIITSPLDEDYLYSNYNKKQLYFGQTIETDRGRAEKMMNSVNPNNFFSKKSEWNENTADANQQKYHAWYYRLMRVDDWIFNGYFNDHKDIYNNDYFVKKDKNGNYTWQANIMQIASHFSFTPFMAAFGKSENYYELMNNGLKPQSVSMNNYIVMSILGNGVGAPDPNNTTLHPYPSETQLDPKNNHCSIVYNSHKEVHLSPADDKTTNYIVFSGSIYLQGVQSFSNWHLEKFDTVDGKKYNIATYYDFENPDINYHGKNNAAEQPDGIVVKSPNDVVVRTDETGKKYAIEKRIAQYEDLPNPKSPLGYNVFDYLIPPTETEPKQLKYLANKQGNKDGADIIDSVQILECEMKIGNKYLCEYYDTVDHTTKYMWADGVEIPFPKNKYYDDNGKEVFAESNHFAISMNPKKDEYIVGEEHEFTNTLTIDDNVDGVKGIAAPIKKSDNLSGELSFKILGPINTQFNNTAATRRHPTWFRHSKYWDNWVSILPFIKNIFIKDFECKLYSNNAGLETLQDKDLIYISDVNTKAVNPKDDITFKICTAISADEAYNFGMKNSANLSYAINGKTNQHVTSLYRHDNVNKKAEELYIDDFYKQYSNPKLIVETELKTNQKYNMFNDYDFNYFKNKKFRLIGESIDVRNCSENIKFREI